MIAPSWTLLPALIATGRPSSPRMEAPGATKTSRSICTSPTTLAPGLTKASGSICGTGRSAFHSVRGACNTLGLLLAAYSAWASSARVTNWSGRKVWSG